MKRKHITACSMWMLVAAVLVLGSGCSRTPWGRWKNEERARLEQGSRIAETAMGPIEYAMVGEGPTLLILHGATGGYDQGLLLGSILSEAGIRTLSISRPGYLRTLLEVGTTPEEQADACAALLDELGIESVAVAGGSGGGPPALQFALRHPDRCWGLLLFCAVVHRQSFERFSLFQRLFSVVTYTDVFGWQMVRRLEKDPVGVLSTVFPATAAAIEGNPDKQELAVRFMKTNFPMGMRKSGTYNDLDQNELQEDYPWEEIAVPTLIMHGTADAWAALSHPEMAARRIPNARLVLFEGADHMFFIPNVEEILEIGKRFAEENAPRSTHLAP